MKVVKVQMNVFRNEPILLVRTERHSSPGRVVQDAVAPHWTKAMVLHVDGVERIIEDPREGERVVWHCFHPAGEARGLPLPHRHCPGPRHAHRCICRGKTKELLEKLPREGS